MVVVIAGDVHHLVEESIVSHQGEFHEALEYHEGSLAGSGRELEDVTVQDEVRLDALLPDEGAQAGDECLHRGTGREGIHLQGAGADVAEKAVSFTQVQVRETDPTDVRHR